MPHLDDIKDKLHIHKNFLNNSICDEILDYVKRYPNIFVDRSKHFQNIGLDNDVGKYYAAEISPFNLTHLWDTYFKNLEFDGFTPYEVQLNKYEKGSFIPPHTDKGMTLHTFCVPLQDNKNNKLIFGEPDVYYNNLDIDESIKNDKIIVFEDKKGYGYHFEGQTPIHWVPKINTERYSLVILI